MPDVAFAYKKRVFEKVKRRIDSVKEREREREREGERERDRRA